MPSPGRFPWWLLAGGLLLSSLYLPTLLMPFDFIDDGNLVYPEKPMPIGERLGVVWSKIVANYEHLGPFRPVLWVHWEIAAEVSGGDPTAWRAFRLCWCVLASTLLLWLMWELGASPSAALLAGAIAVWNPYRSFEIWTSNTLAEGVAMPYALFAMIAARKARDSARPSLWDAGAWLSILAALGCKNTFAVVVPVMVFLRCCPADLSIVQGLRRSRLPGVWLSSALLLPIGHFIYFKLNWHAGQYQTHGASFAQVLRILNAMKGGLGLDFLACGLGLVIATICFSLRTMTESWGAVRRQLVATWWTRYRTGLVAGGMLAVGGMIVYIPIGAISPRYTMPGIWGVDIWVALVLTEFLRAHPVKVRRAAWVGLAAGLAGLVTANLGKQEKFTARARMLHQAVAWTKANAEPNACIAWVSGDPAKGGLHVEEGIHFLWHLRAAGRPDLRVTAVDESGRALQRVELPSVTAKPNLILVGGVDPRPTTVFAEGYRAGRRTFACSVRRAAD